MKTKTKSLDRQARLIAKDEHLNNFKSRRGVGTIDGKLYLYDNNPWAAGAHFRDEELAEFRRRLKAEGITEAGYGVYPEIGEEVGYTYALILDCGEDREEWVREVWQQLIRQTSRKMDEQRAAAV